MKKATDFFKSLWKDESAQGATEYILLLVIVVAVAMLFKDRIRQVVTSQFEKVDQGMGGLSTQF